MSRFLVRGLVGLAVYTVMFGVNQAQAVPTLQIYLEGGTYNTVTESWELTPQGSSGGAPFRLWVIGNVAGPGGKGLIKNVRLSTAYDATGSAPSITLTPSTTGGFGGFADPSVPAGTGTFVQTVLDGSTPILGDGSLLPSHGIYGAGTHWQEFLLGDFGETDSPVGDFINAFPTAPTTLTGQINVYEVSVLGGSGTTVHFDVYDTIVSKNHARFAPFSHDADGDVNVVPEPSTFLLLSPGLVGFLGYGWRKRKQTTKASST